MIFYYSKLHNNAYIRYYLLLLYSSVFEQLKGMISKRQKRLAELMRLTSGTIRVDDVIRTFGLSRLQANKLLSNWHNQGVLRRISHGLYVPAKPSDLGQTQILEDPWILVPELFDQGYIAGWSAAEHWELTEQMFRSICVLTSKRTEYGMREIQGVKFYVKYVPKRLLFGIKTIWKDHIKIAISDPHKTILDILNEPYLGAGIQHTFDCFKQYVTLYKKDLPKLLEYADRSNNGALFKKLGYFAELLNLNSEFIAQCQEKLTKGYSVLDNSAKNKKLVTRWRIWVPKNWRSND